jgi:hypothetical protein
MRISIVESGPPQVAIRNPESGMDGGLTVAQTMSDEHAPVPPAGDRQAQVEVQESSLTIHDLSIERASIVDYLKTIAPDKQTIALVHALEVGVTEMLARRERFRH